MNATAYFVGIVLQGLAAAIALVQIRRAPHRLPWLFVALSSLLIVIRRSATMGEFLRADRPLALGESLTLAVSVLFLAGVVLMSRMFNEVAQSQRQLRENQTRLDMAMEAAQAGTWEWDLESNENRWSPELWALYGLDPGVPASYQAWRDSILPADREHAEQTVQAAAREGRELAAEWRVRKSDGKIAWLMSRGKPVRDAGGTVRKYLGVVFDITARKQVEQVMAEQERMQATLLQNLPGFVYRCRNDRAWTMTFVSGAFQDVTGYRGDEILGNRTRPYNDLILPEYRDFVWRQCQEAIAARRQFELEYPIRAAGGEVRWLWERGRGVFDADGRLLFLEGYVEDDTSRRLAIEQLRISEERLSLATDAAGVGVWDWNVATGDVVYDERWHRMLGYAPGELEPKVSTWESRLHPDDMPEVMRCLHDHLEGRTPQYQSEHRARHKSGHWVWVLDTGRVTQRDVEGKPLRACGTHQDITEQKGRERLLQMEADIFTVLNGGLDVGDMIRPIVATIKGTLGCDAVGIRLRRGEDFPYWGQEGFSEEFAKKENTLACIAEGVLQRDADGRPILECTCGLVLSGRTPLDNPLFTPGGSCWTNDSAALPEAPPDEDPRRNPRNRCIGEGYRTVALIPLRSGNEILGLLQLNYRNAEALSIATVTFLERLCVAVGSSLGRRQAENAYRQSRAELDLTFESMGDGVISCDSDWRLVYLNNRAEEITGLRRQDILGRSLWDVFPLTLGTRLEQEYRRAAAGEPRDLENLYEPLDRWFHNRCYPRQGGGVIVYFQDITTRKKAEQAARDADMHKRVMFDLSPDGLVLVDPATGKILEFNEAAHRNLGYSREEFSRMSIQDLKAVEPPEQTLARMQRVLQAGGGEFETVHKTRDGALRTVMVKVTALELQNQRLLFSIMRDVTEHRETEEKLIQSQKMEAIGQLAGGVAHDFRNQLTVIQGFAEMLERRNLVDGRGREMLGHILKAAERSSLLTGQLLAFSRKQILQPKRIDVTETVTDLAKVIPRMLGEDVSVVLEPCMHPCLVEIDPGQFQQALVNLVTNARDAMPTGGQLTIGVAAGAPPPELAAAHPEARGSSFVAVAVTDTGCGMDETVKARIFEPFFTTKEVGQGTGLGLPMVYGFVEQSGGFLDVSSAPGRGTTITLYFPRVREDVAAVKPADRASEKTLEGTEMILLVEDDPSVRGILAAGLEEAGYTVVLACSAEEGYAALREDTGLIRLLLTDVVMPGTSGVEMVRKILQEHPRLPVLYMSGYPERELTRRKVQFLPGHLLSKPIDYRVLLAKVREFLDAPPPPAAP